MHISIDKLPVWVPFKWPCLPPTQMFPFSSPQSFRVHVGIWTNLKESGGSPNFAIDSKNLFNRTHA